MTDWFDRTYTLTECCKQTANRIVAIRRKDVWYRGFYASMPKHIEFLHRIHQPVYSMYVSGFTFDWGRFKNEHGQLPSATNRHAYRDWVADNIVPALNDLILTKDLVFEIDKRKGVNVSVAGEYALRIIEYLRSNSMKHYIIFSGGNGYHVVAEDVEQYLEKYDINMTGRTIRSLSWAAIAIASKILDEIFGDEPYVDQRSKGRSYDDVDIHFSPMYPQGVRKAPYSLTDYGTVALPVGEHELRMVDDVEYYLPRNILNKYTIVNRGIYVGG